MSAYIVVIISFMAAALLSPIVIPILTRLKFGQSIREIGPSWHNKKSGTPTMGGLIFIFASLLGTLFFVNKLDTSVVLVVYCSLGFGVIGFIDDFIKVVLKRNLGLLAWQKLAMQILVSVTFVYLALHTGLVSTAINIPFSSITFDFGIFYIPVAIFIIVGVVNSVNLTDGIDGLATSVTIIVILFFATITALLKMPLFIFCYGLVGALFGFLLFNKHPAKVFMGDTGSLFLGGVVASSAIIINQPFILILVGFIYFCESLSVIIQVISFKLTGKRVFKMSPIHHHFEMSGWSETKIVRIFTTVTLILSIIAYFGCGVG